MRSGAGMENPLLAVEERELVDEVIDEELIEVELSDKDELIKAALETCTELLERLLIIDELLEALELAGLSESDELPPPHPVSTATSSTTPISTGLHNIAFIGSTRE